MPITLGKFASLYASALGQRLWAFLTRPENVARLETASELSKPAVEGIEEQLLAEFREDVLAHRVKQMVGHMVRQIIPDFSPKNSVESDYLLQTNRYRNFREATKIQGVFPFRAVFRPAAGGFARFRRAIVSNGFQY